MQAMGRSLQQTAISTNIKERLDYSCALFSPDGDLVANAPFIPVEHELLLSLSPQLLTADLLLRCISDQVSRLVLLSRTKKMQTDRSISVSFAVKYQLKLHGKDLRPGDVLMTNSPVAGGRSVLARLGLFVRDIRLHLFHELTQVHSLVPATSPVRTSRARP